MSLQRVRTCRASSAEMQMRKAPIDEARLKVTFEKSEALKAEFGDLKSFLEFKSKIVVQVLENYVLRANGGGDRRRGFAGQVALKKCR